MLLFRAAYVSAKLAYYADFLNSFAIALVNLRTSSYSRSSDLASFLKWRKISWIVAFVYLGEAVKAAYYAALGILKLD